REQDAVFLLEAGEFEDMYTPELIVKTIHDQYLPSHPVTIADFAVYDGQSRVLTLQKLWARMGLGQFDKIEFAQALVKTLSGEDLVASAMGQLVQNIIQGAPD